jgi:hypothetical protein
MQDRCAHVHVHELACGVTTSFISPKQFVRLETGLCRAGVPILRPCVQLPVTSLTSTGKSELLRCDTRHTASLRHTITEAYTMTGACTITEADSGVILECVRCRLQQASGPEIEMASRVANARPFNSKPHTKANPRMKDKASTRTSTPPYHCIHCHPTKPNLPSSGSPDLGR